MCTNYFSPDIQEKTILITRFDQPKKDPMKYDNCQLQASRMKKTDNKSPRTMICSSSTICRTVLQIKEKTPA